MLCARNANDFASENYYCDQRVLDYCIYFHEGWVDGGGGFHVWTIKDRYNGDAENKKK